MWSDMPEAGASGWQPLEQLAVLGRATTSIRIGIPRERNLQERRVALTPAAVKTLVARGHQVFIEHKAGEQAAFPDRLYTEAGPPSFINPKTSFKPPITWSKSPLSQKKK